MQLRTWRRIGHGAQFDFPSPRILREVGLVEVERDAVDARWVYYSINQSTLAQLAQSFGAFFDPTRIKERHPACGPQGSVVRVDDYSGGSI